MPVIRHPYVQMTSSTAVLVARVLTQTLSNMVTGNDNLISRIWEIYMNLPEDQVILLYVHRNSRQIFGPCGVFWGILSFSLILEMPE